ncbi:DUF3180 family protein [Agromyces soli]
MKRTHAPSLLALAAVGLAVGYLGDLAIVSSGASALVPPLSLALTLALVGVVVVAFAWPIRRAVKGTGRRVDPFRAMRVAALAKACSLSGALVTGIGAGIALFLLTRTVVSSAASVWLSVATTAGALLLLVGGLVAEHFCTLPPDDPEDEEPAHA